MPLDPDLEGFLELAQLGRLTGKSQPMHQLSVAQARHDFEQSSQVLDPSPPAAVNVRTVSIPTRDGATLDARLYRATQNDQTLPVIVYFHGGGYVVGSLDSHDSICRRLAASGRHAVLAPAYRLAPEYPFPAAVHDALDSTRWVHEHATQLAIDREQISLAGDSAGATLATVVAITAEDPASDWAFRPKAQLLFYPVTDTSTTRASHQRYAEGYLLESQTLEWFYQHYMPRAEQRADWRASPLRASNLVALAPAYISLAQYDPLYDEGLAYAELLRANGTPVTLENLDGLTHDFLRMSGISGQVESVYRNAEQWLATL